jgi:hypothetical protein
LRECSADADGLSLGLDHEDDALLRSGVGRFGVLRWQLVEAIEVPSSTRRTSGLSMVAIS